MDAATAALWASSITGAVALGGALLAPHLTAKRARETELLKMRRDAYVAALQLAASVMVMGHAPEDLGRISRDMMPVTVQLRLLGNEDLADQWSQLTLRLGEIAKHQAERKNTHDELHEFGRSIAILTDTMRAHLGVDEIER